MQFHQAKWNEPLVFEQSRKGAVGYSIPTVSKAIQKILPKPFSSIPKAMQRKTLLKLPELSEPEVVQHFVRLSQMNYCIDLGLYPLGSCTMKYNPPMNEELARHPRTTLVAQT